VDEFFLHTGSPSHANSLSVSSKPVEELVEKYGESHCRNIMGASFFPDDEETIRFKLPGCYRSLILQLRLPSGEVTSIDFAKRLPPFGFSLGTNTPVNIGFVNQRSHASSLGIQPGSVVMKVNGSMVEGSPLEVVRDKIHKVVRGLALPTD